MAVTIMSVKLSGTKHTVRTPKTITGPDTGKNGRQVKLSKRSKSVYTAVAAMAKVKRAVINKGRLAETCVARQMPSVQPATEVATTAKRRLVHSRMFFKRTKQASATFTTAVSNKTMNMLFASLFDDSKIAQLLLGPRLGRVQARRPCPVTGSQRGRRRPSELRDSRMESRTGVVGAWPRRSRVGACGQR